MDIKEAAKELDISISTLRYWERELGLKLPRDSRNRRKVDENVIQIFEKVKELRGQDSGLNTIRKIINDDTNTLQNEIKPATNELQNDFNLTTNTLQELIKNEIKSAITEQTELSEKYAKATYKIGELETTNKFLLKENEKLQDKIKLLPEPNEIQNLINELEKTKQKLEKYELPWWKKFFKK